METSNHGNTPRDDSQDDVKAPSSLSETQNVLSGLSQSAQTENEGAQPESQPESQSINGLKRKAAAIEDVQVDPGNVPSGQTIPWDRTLRCMDPNIRRINEILLQRLEALEALEADYEHQTKEVQDEKLWLKDCTNCFSKVMESLKRLADATNVSLEQPLLCNDCPEDR